MGEHTVLLELQDVRSGYGRGEVLHGIDFSIGRGEVVAVLGPNGAGKSTLLRTIAGLVKVRSGALVWDGKSTKGIRAAKAVGAGIALVPEGREIFQSLTIKENLLLGAFSRKQGAGTVDEDIERMYGYFPILRERQRYRGAELSGGQQQMLAIARGLMSHPRLLLLDEPSLGLSPVMVDSLTPLISALVKDFDTSIVVVEQNASLALAVSQRAYLLQTGNIELAIASSEMAELLKSHNLYFGSAEPAGARTD